MDDIDIHRLRIGTYLPNPIKSIAVDSFYGQKVAIGREDGEIEIIDPNSNFSALAKVSGSSDFKLQALQWSLHNEETRLFGISLKGFLFEVSLEQLIITNIQDVYGGAAWCLVGSPREPLLAIGGEKGLIRLFRYHSIRGLDYERSISTSSDRILSVAYHPSSPRLFVGGNDGIIRCIDEKTEQTLFLMIGDLTPKTKSSPCIWALSVIDDNTVISGDSLGQVQVWDGAIGVLQQTLANHHLGDILNVVHASNGSSFFTAGVDGKVNCFRRAKIPELSSSGNADYSLPVPLSGSQSWHLSQSYRIHSHDVFTLAICAAPASSNSWTKAQPQNKLRRGNIEEGVEFDGEEEFIGGDENTAKLEIIDGHLLLSGGLDSKLCFYSVDCFDVLKPFWLPLVHNASENKVVHLARNQSMDVGLCLTKYNRFIDLWRILMPRSDEAGGSDCELLLRLKHKEGVIESSDHINVAIVASNGNLLFFAGNSFQRLLSISYNSHQQAVVTEIPLPTELLLRSRFISVAAFDTFDERLYLWDSLNGSLILLKILSSQGTVRVILVEEFALFSEFIEFNVGWTPVERKLGKQVKRLCFSPTSDYLAVVSCANVVYIFQTDKMIKRWTVPKTSIVIADIDFARCVEAEEIQTHLFVLLSDGRLLVYCVEALQLVGDFRQCSHSIVSCWSSHQQKGPKDFSAFSGLCVIGSEDVTEKQRKEKQSYRTFLLGCYSAMNCTFVKICLPAFSFISNGNSNSKITADQKRRKRDRAALQDIPQMKEKIEILHQTDRYRNILSMQTISTKTQENSSSFLSVVSTS